MTDSCWYGQVGGWEGGRNGALVGVYEGCNLVSRRVNYYLLVAVRLV